MIKIFFSLKFLIIFNIIFFVIIIGTIFYLADKNKRCSYKEIKQDYSLYCKYIDKYYINKIYYTIFAFSIYIFINFLMVFILRYVALGQMIDIMKISMHTASLFNVNILVSFLGFWGCFILGFIFVKYLTMILFYEDVVKVKIYLAQFDFLFTIKRLFRSNPVERYLKFLAYISYRIATGTYNSELFKEEFDDWYNKQLDYSEVTLREFYENSYIKLFAEYCMYYAKKYKIIYKIFYTMAFVFNFLRNLCHDGYSINGFFRYFIYPFFVIIIIIDIYNRQLYYIYYINFIYFFIHLHQRYCKYEKSLDSYTIYVFSNYFYKNEKPYYLQRVSILNNIHNINNYSEQNNEIQVGYISGTKKAEPSGHVYNVLNQMKKPFTSSESTLKEDKARNRSFIRYHIIILFFILGIFLIFFHNNFIISIFDQTVSNYIIFMPIIIMGICAKGAYKKKIFNKFTLDEYESPYSENVFYKAIFWIICILQGYLFWLLILKVEIFILDTETLLNISFILKLPEEILCTMPYEGIKQMPENLLNYNMLTIKKVYTLEEKIQYLYAYFDLYVSSSALASEDKDYLRHILRQMHFEFIKDTTTLKDIQWFIKIFIENLMVFAKYMYIFKRIMIIRMEYEFLAHQNYLRVKAFLNTVATIITTWVTFDTVKFYVRILKIVIKPTSRATRVFASSIMNSIIDYMLNHYRR